jgi:DNA-binding MarR family transcriptional regulator
MSPDIRSKGVEFARAVSRECACGSLRRAARILTKLYDDALKPTGLKVTQFGLLSNLMALGSSTLTQLADAMVVDHTTLTRNLDVLEARGLVVTEEGEDRRERQLRLSDKGIASLSDAYPLWQAAQARAMRIGGVGNWTAAGPLLRRLASSSSSDADTSEVTRT